MINPSFQKSGESQRVGRQQSKTAAAGVKKASELKRNSNSKPPAQGELAGKQGAANSKRMPKKGNKELRAQKGDDSALTVSQGGHDSQASCASRAKIEKDGNTNGLNLCRYEGTYTPHSQRKNPNLLLARHMTFDLNCTLLLANYLTRQFAKMFLF